MSNTTPAYSPREKHKDTLRSILRQLRDLPESSQKVIQSGVFELLKNEKEKVQKLENLKDYLQKE